MKFQFLAIVITGFLLSSCGNNNTGKDSPTQGSISIIVDEAFLPIIEDEYQIFENNYKRAKINFVYKPERELLQVFLNDSIRTAIISRKLSETEESFYKKRNISVNYTKFATDGIALIVNEKSTDTLFLVDQLKNWMSGKAQLKKKIVIDNPQSGSVRYLKELSGVNQFPEKNIYALKSNEEVIKYVANNNDAIGIVGIGWVTQPGDELDSLAQKVRIAAIKSKSGNYHKPSQNNLITKDYPLTRDLYVIDCQGKVGLGTGFASFLAGEVGQRIVLKSGLGPATLPPREVIIRNK